MVKFQPYNIIIHGTTKRRRAGFPFEDDNGPSAKSYEERIRVTLNAIGNRSVGRVLFRSLCAAVPVYVVPYTGDTCNARTGQLTSDWKQGIWIQYSPENWTYDNCGRYPGYRPVETLFHEMVHASRFTNYGGFAGINLTPLDRMLDYEEFLAVMLTNVFRSEEGARKFNRDYVTGALVSQSDLELFLSSRIDYINAVDYFLKDQLVKLVVPLTTPFNPFRDIKKLKSNYAASPLRGFIPELLRR